MFSKLFGKKPAPAKAVTLSVPEKAAAQREAAQNTKDIWTSKLQACLGNDQALLALAQEAPLLEIKESAVAALVSEESLRLAERAFRTQNQRVHRLAKQCYLTVVAQRENQAKARQLIDAASALLNELSVPANRLVELDQAWQKLEANALTDILRTEFEQLSSQLTTQLRDRTEQSRNSKQWATNTRERLKQLSTACEAIGTGDATESELATAVEALQTALTSRPATALQSITVDDQRLESECQKALLKAEEVAVQQAAKKLAQATIAVAPPTITANEAAPKTIKKTASDPSVQQALLALVKTAETALAGGQLAEARTHLQAIDQTTGHDNEVSPSLLARIEALKAEFARLKGWQHWGGGRAREDLLDQAESLARSVNSMNSSNDADAASSTKINVKQLAKDIEQYRQRWKDLDRLGGAGGKALWPRFDAALKAAYVPVAALQAKLKAAREENLEARKRLIGTLDAIGIEPADDGASPDWREIARTLEHIESEWRKLGPADHTVPRSMLDGLLKKWTSSVRRIEVPIHAVRAVAQSERRKLIERAQGLLTASQQRDVISRVRELQAEWQQQAKSIPLPRNTENALWTEFKLATDQIFKQRDAEAATRTAEYKTHQETRERLIQRLTELSPKMPSAEINRAITDIDREWRSAGEVNHGVAARLDAQFRAAHASAVNLVTSSRKLSWQATCDALREKLALCKSAETLDASTATTLETPWPIHPNFPQTWETALQARFSAAVAANGNSIPPLNHQPAEQRDCDMVLLQLESALDIASPLEFHAARRELKLQTMKDALERKRLQSAERGNIALLVNKALGRPLSPAQNLRLDAIIAALRERPEAGT